MRNFLRSPLAWLVAAEVIVIGTLGIVIWNVVQNAGRPVLASPEVQAPAVVGDAGSPLPAVAEIHPSSQRGPRPGLNLDSAFWRQRLAQLNSDQVLLEQLEWRIVHNAMDAANRYVETVALDLQPPLQDVAGTETDDVVAAVLCGACGLGGGFFSLSHGILRYVFHTFIPTPATRGACTSIRRSSQDFRELAS